MRLAIRKVIHETASGTTNLNIETACEMSMTSNFAL
jgi:hypothetical protein